MADNHPSREERVRRIAGTFQALVWVAARLFSRQLQPFGLTHAQFIVLAVLAAHRQPCTMSDLTTITWHGPPPRTGIVDRLIKMKLAQRTRSQTDRRVVLVEATPAGIDLTERIRASVLTGEMFTFTDEELAELEQHFRHVLGMHLKYLKGKKKLDDAELDAEISKLQLFKCDTSLYASSEKGVKDSTRDEASL